MRGDLIEIFKIINGLSNYARHFLIFLLKLEIHCQNRLKKQSLETNWIFLSHGAINFCQKLSNQIKKLNNANKGEIELDIFRKKKDKKKK